MKALAALTPRERLLIFGGGAVLLVLGVWFYAWQPITRTQETETGRIARYLALIDLARDEDATTPAQPISQTPDAPLAQRVTQSGEAGGIPLARLDPEGSRLRVTVAEAPYAALMDWIASLEAQAAVRALSVEMSRLTAPGMVSLRITLEDAL